MYMCVRVRVRVCVCVCTYIFMHVTRTEMDTSEPLLPGAPLESSLAITRARGCE